MNEDERDRARKLLESARIHAGYTPLEIQILIGRRDTTLLDLLNEMNDLRRSGGGRGLSVREERTYDMAWSRLEFITRPRALSRTEHMKTAFEMTYGAKK
jgi:hypothetical protein